MAVSGANIIVILCIIAAFSSVLSFCPSAKFLKQQQQTSRRVIRSKSSTGNNVSTKDSNNDESSNMGVLTGLLDGLFNRGTKQQKQQSSSVNAKDTVLHLVRNRNCFSTVEGAKEFAETCADDVVYEDCYLTNPVIGKEVGHSNSCFSSLVQSSFYMRCSLTIFCASLLMIYAIITLGCCLAYLIKSEAARGHS
jgi:hypothetical protein